MIIFNETTHGIKCGKVFLMPGSNVVNDSDFDCENAIVKSWIEKGDIRVAKEVNEAVAVEAINKACFQSTVDEIEKKAPAKSEKVKKAAVGRKKMLDDFDAEVKKAIDEAKKKKEEGAK